MSLAVIAGVAALGAVGGLLGALLGLGGGVFLVPFLSLFIGLPFRQAAAIGLMTVIATSSVVSAQRSGDGVINIRLGIVLEIATTLGGLAGGLTALSLSQRTLSVIFGLVALAISVVMFRQIDKRTSMADPPRVTGWLGGQYYSPDHGAVVSYQVKRVPVALGMSFIAGNVSGLLGIGGGILKVPTLNAWCGVPLRVAAATSSLMLGVTAVASVPIYYAAGEVIPELAAAAVVGVMIGSRGGFWVGDRVKARWLKMLLSFILLGVAILMLVRG